MVTTRLCRMCQNPLVKRANESRSCFAERQTCSPGCAAKLREQNRLQAMTWPTDGLALAEAMKGWKLCPI